MSCRKFILWAVFAASLLGLGGCKHLPNRGTIRAPDVTVRGVADAGKPASLNTSKAEESVKLPPASKITVIETPAAVATETAPAQPAKTVTVIEPGGSTEWVKTASTVSADTGTIDTSVTKHRIDVAERRWLLWAAIGCGIGGLVIKSMMPAWPALSNGLLLGAVFAGLSWKLSDIPSWIWLVVLGIVGALAAGYKRAEWDKDGDGIPDLLEKK